MFGGYCKQNFCDRGERGGAGRAGPPITGILFVNLPNSRLPNQ